MPTDEFERPSRSALKRQAEKLQKLGETLIDMPADTFDQLPLPEVLRDAVRNARRFTSHGAQLRQRQYIGKLMRKIDVALIRAAIDAQQLERQTEARRFHRIETWRDRLITEPEIALPALLAELPGADGEQLLSLAVEAAEESRQRGTARASRQLFKYLRELFSLQ